MKILLIITDYGSFNNFLSELAVQLVHTGHEVYVICSAHKVINFRDKHSFTDLGIVFHYVDFPRSFNLIKQLAVSAKIHKIIKEIDPYLINVHFTTAIFTTVLLRKPTHFTIGTMHGVGYPMIKSKIRRKIFEIVERICFRRLDQIYLINRFDYELVKKNYPDKAFIYQSFGVGNDLQKFDPAAVPGYFREILRNKLLIKPDDFVLAFTGRFTAFKGFGVVIKAFNSLKKQYRIPDIKLLIIGGEDPVHINGLTPEETADYRNNDDIIQVGFTANVNLYLAIADLFVFPSGKEGMPVCVMEALSMGLPVITTDSRGCHDLVQHHVNGLLLNTPSVSETREAILKLYRDRGLLRKLSENALAGRTGFSRQTFIEDQIEVYHKVSRQIKCA